MKVTVLFFSVLRDETGRDSISLDCPADGISLGAILDLVVERFPGIAGWKDRLLCAVNCEYADFSTPIQDGDEIAFMPPVQGG